MKLTFRSVLAALTFAFALCAASIAATPPATWTTGHKKILIIPVRFTDFGGPSDVPSASGVQSGWGNIVNGTMTAEISAFMARQSYGRCTLEFTRLPEINMGASYLAWNVPLNSDSLLSKYQRWAEPGSFSDDVRARARQVGLATANPAMYDTDNYDLDIVATGFLPIEGAFGIALNNGKGIRSNTFTILPHEICHNLGLGHARGISRSTFLAPLKRNAFYDVKYGNVFDLMGEKNIHATPLPPDRDAGVFWKYKLGWMPAENIITAEQSGTFRIHAFDVPLLDAGKFYGMRIVHDPWNTFWFEYRQNITGSDAHWAQNGLSVQLGAEEIESSAGNTTMLDMTPGSRGLAGSNFATFHDGLLAIGRTFSDANMHVTPVAKGGTVPESLDVVVNHGPFPGNVAPVISISPGAVALTAGVAQTFTASATDANGDALAYYWEFDDFEQVAGVKTGGLNPDSRLATQATHTWTRNGTYLVRCTATDMRGGATIASAEVTVTGGSAERLTISGIVRDENGQPLHGAVVNNLYLVPPPSGVRPFTTYHSADFAASGETAADGKFCVQLPDIGAHTYTLTVMHGGYDFECSVPGGAIAVSNASISGINFTRIRANRTLSGSIQVGGRSYNPATDGPLTIGTGSESFPAGNASWSRSVPDGTLVNITATPANPAHSVASSFYNPHLVVNDVNTFYFALKIPGQMPETSFTTSSASSDDTVGTVQIPVTMTLPPGYNTWPGQQDFFYWIDASSTAEYGVDYKASGGLFTFYANKVPTPRSIPLKIIRDGKPKNKTVVIKLGIGSNSASLGPISTFTYTITNPFRITSLMRTGNMLTLVWDSAAGVNYTIESTPALSPATWTPVAPHIALPGTPGNMSRTVPMSDGAKFFRIKAAW